MPRKIPERWEDYTPIGKRIPGTRFIAFKVPLKWELCQSLPCDLWFTPSSLMNKVRNLGLIIDLTNTTRYYLPKEFTDHCINYRKVQCEGKLVPGHHVVSRFFKVVEEFLQLCQDSDTLIGVHCTHGVNRTGYLVCRYMIERLGVSPLDAIQEFNKARGFDIERINYLDSLKTSTEDITTSCVQDIHSAFQNRYQQQIEYVGPIRATSSRRNHFGDKTAPYPKNNPKNFQRFNRTSSDQAKESRYSNPMNISAHFSHHHSRTKTNPGPNKHILF